MNRFSFLNAVHPEFVDELYQKYLRYPDSVENSWKNFFQGYDFAMESLNGEDISMDSISLNGKDASFIEKEFKVIQLIDDYRTRGHLFTKTNPVRQRRTYTPNLDISNFGLTENDLDVNFHAGEILGIGGPTTLRNIIAHLEQIYCDSIGIEYMYIRNPEIVRWIQLWINDNLNHPKLTPQEKERIFHKVNQAVAFENFLHTKFVGQKRFSLEGGESLIPALDELINRSAQHGVEEIVLGMAHRGRLNVLSNIFEKSYSQIFSEFEGKDYEDAVFSGDVKYHLGSTTETTLPDGKKMKLNLAPNPSHLEAVNPVVEGIARAKIDNDYQGDESKVLPILIHGDAAIAGQGIVYEVIQMMSLDGYRTGGTVHIVVNNQIGFTTNYLDTRSSIYCTDVAKVTHSPVMHVNADDVEAVVHAIRFAADFRARFHRDVFIDLLGYRKYGHNEGDEPRFTQPQLYKIIAKHPNPREIYREKLISEGIVSDEFIKRMDADFKKILEDHFEASKSIELNDIDPFMQDEWEGIPPCGVEKILEKVSTGVPVDKLKYIGEIISTPPAGKKFLGKINRLLQQRREMIFDKNQLDWGVTETLLYGTLLLEGHPVRISGEDVERGTFSHRHAILKTEDDEEEICLLNHLSDSQAPFRIYNSLLSEYGVLGFDYGYAMASPESLVVWEAQFGDFVNGAQIMIDQYISSAEDKWKIQNGLVMYLPHGYEGQGAEHSSARLERFLQACANGNMIVANCTTPANFFHLIRRPFIANYRKPVVIMTPKSLLRHPRAVSTLEDLSEGNFQEIIDDIVDVKNVERVVLCSGKLYYELLEKREQTQMNSIALIRIEQLYPLHRELLDSILNRYTNKKEIVWAQEEPENMGAWWYMLRTLRDLNLKLISPPESGAPTTGSYQRFHKIQHQLIENIFKL